MWKSCSGVIATVLSQDASLALLCASSGVSSRVRAEGVYYSRCKWWAWCALLLRAPAAATAAAAALLLLLWRRLLCAPVAVLLSTSVIP